MLRALPHVLWFVGIVLIFQGLARLSGAGLPDQDANAVLLEKQREQIQSAQTTAILGGLMVFSGLAWWKFQMRAKGAKS
jgi:hypothetical protein